MLLSSGFVVYWQCQGIYVNVLLSKESHVVQRFVPRLSFLVFLATLVVNPFKDALPTGQPSHPSEHQQFELGEDQSIGHPNLYLFTYDVPQLPLT